MPKNTHPSLKLLIAVTVALTACGLETKPNPNYKPPTNDGAVGGAGGAGGTAGKKAGGGAGAVGGTGGTSGRSGTGGTSSKDAGMDASMMKDAGHDAGHAGSGGAAAIDAGVDAGPCGGPCTAPTPVCDDASGLCVECGGDIDCTSTGKPACDKATKTCVQCTKKADCGGRTTTPVCDVAAHACVGCLLKSDCGGGTPQCDTGAKGCVECLANADCGDAAKARCDVTDHTCKGCTADAQCTRLTATPVCDEVRATCVECTGDTEVTRCASNSCKRSTGTCTTTPRTSLNACSLCEADSECKTGLKCVTHHFDSTHDLGPYCFYDKVVQGGCSDAVGGAPQPYSQSVATTSIDGATATYCLPITSCEAVADAIAASVGGGMSCLSTSSTPDSSKCGVPNVADGYCIDDASANQGKCSYHCQSDVDCPPSGTFVHCLGSIGAKFCQP